jgi:O-antigen ligase
MAAFAVYALAQHANFDFRPDQAALAPRPFFPENTLWGACTAVVLLAHAGTLLGKRPSARDLGIGLALLTAWVSSNSLGAWASLAVAACWWLFGALSGNKRLYLTLGVCLVTSVAAKPMLRVLGSDVSVQERLNRWRCAVEMAGQRPWTGFGPGTYAFQYQPFQRAGSMTRISSEAPLRVGEQAILGRGGGAHSEYARALAETGWPGLALWLLTVVAFLAAAGKASHWSAALACFFLHAWANDFLHDPRMAALVWGGLAYCGAKNKEVWPGLGYSAQS